MTPPIFKPNNSQVILLPITLILTFLPSSSLFNDLFDYAEILFRPNNSRLSPLIPSTALIPFSGIATFSYTEMIACKHLLEALFCRGQGTVVS